MIQSATNYPVSQLFDVESKHVYVIPRYQREYTWGKSHWETLFGDLDSNDPGYFLGSIICINQARDSLAVQRLDLVDGQQRLLTLSLLIVSLYKCLKRHYPNPDGEQSFELYNLKKKIVLAQESNPIRLELQIQGSNREDYLSVLSEAGIIGDRDNLPNAGNRRIFRAYKYFKERIDKIIENETDNLDGVIKKFLNKVNQACMVKIEVASHADAYVLFESLNNRGMSLTAIDLIKNKLLAKLENNEQGQINENYECWMRFLGYLGDDYVVQERFFRHYYNAFKHELQEIHSFSVASVATRSNLIRIYQQLIDYDASQFLTNISENASVYSQILSRGTVEESLTKPFKDLERIQGAPSHLLLLYLLARKKNLNLTYSHIASITSLLVCFFVRRNLTDTPPTRELDRFFMKMIEEIRPLSGDSVKNSIQQQLVGKSASVEVFKEKLRGSIYDENRDATRFVLCSIAENAMTNEQWTNLWSRSKKGQFAWTIEHIFPQGENIPQCWIDMIANGNIHLAKNYQQEHVHRLGNLTITGFNRELGNKSFEEKRDRQDSNGLFIGYKNGLMLNERLAKENQWSIQNIEERTDQLIREITQLFGLE